MVRLKDTVVSLEKEEPPKYPYRFIEGDLSEKKPLGMKILDHFKEQHIADDTRVAVYVIEGCPDEYRDSDLVPYYYKESVDFVDYKNKYLKED